MDLLGMEAALYLRKSRAEDGMPTAEILRRHKETLTEYASANGMRIVETFQEVKSGESLYARPEMMRLLESVEAGRFRAVLCMDIDRLSRGETRERGLIWAAFKASGTLIVTPGKTYDLSEESDELMTELRGLFANFELRKIKERTRRGVTRAVKEGQCLVPAPYGYRKTVIARKHTLEIYEPEAKFVRMIFSLYASGLGSRAIANRLNDAGARPRRADIFTNAAVLNILKNRAYVGRITYNKTHWTRKGDGMRHVPRPESEWIVVDGAHPAIVDEATFEECQRILKSRWTPARFDGEIKATLAGLIVCKRCGKHMQKRWNNGYPYLRCDRPHFILLFGQIKKRQRRRVMSGKRKAEVAYKETVVFELFPTLEYDKTQKQRLISFHAYKNNIRRIINYAAHFDKPNCLCMVYIVGEVTPEKIQKLLAAAECSERVCVLTSPFPEDELAFWKAFDQRRDTLKKQGNWDDERQTVTAEWLHNRDVEIWWQGELNAAQPDLDGQLCIDAPALAVPDLWREHNAKLVAESAETLDMIRRYHALARKAPSYFRRWTLHRRGREPTPFRHADTGKLTAKIYPYGAEARGVNAYASLSPASIEPAVKLVTDGAENRRLGFDLAFVTDFKPVRKIRKFVEDALAAQGYCTLSALADFIKSPPFGLDNNGYSAAILSAALYDVPGLLFFDSLTDSPLQQEGMLYLCRKILPQEDSRPAFNYRRAGVEYCLYREYPCHGLVRDALAGLYGLENYAGRYIVTYSRAKIETLFRLPLSVSDDLLFRLTGPEIRWHDRAEIERLAAEVTTRRDELPRVLAAHIAKDKRIPQKHWIPGAACWLWDAESLFDSPYCMMFPEEQAQYDAYKEQAYQFLDMEKAIRWDRTEGWKERKKEAERKSLNAVWAERDYLKDRLEPCRRRLQALCGKRSP